MKLVQDFDKHCTICKNATERCSKCSFFNKAQFNKIPLCGLWIQNELHCAKSTNIHFMTCHNIHDLVHRTCYIIY